MKKTSLLKVNFDGDHIKRTLALSGLVVETAICGWRAIVVKVTHLFPHGLEGNPF